MPDHTGLAEVVGHRERDNGELILSSYTHQQQINLTAFLKTNVDITNLSLFNYLRPQYMQP